MNILYVILGITIPLVVVLTIWGIIINNNITKFMNQLNTPEETNIIPGNPMTFQECKDVIDTVIHEVYVNKYQLYYTLKEIKIIPNMDDEILNMSREVLGAFSETQYREFSRYYTHDYLGQYITRTIQLLFIDYTDKNKPNVG